MQCRICGSTGEHRTYVAKEMMLGLRDEHRYFQCVDCNCLQIETIPDELARYYPENYYSYRDTATAGNAIKRFLVQQRDTYAATGHNLVGRLMQFLSPNTKLATLRPAGVHTQSHILDVGCGAGHLLHSLRAVGFQHLLGIDPFNRETIRYDNGLVIEKQDIFNTNGEWDLITFHHSFEHLPDQQAHLKRAFELLKAGGMALVRVPTVSSWAWQEYGVNWVQLDAPRHLYLHSLMSMHQLATQVGFQLEQVIYDSNGFQFWGSQQYEHDIALREPRSWAENPTQSLFDAKHIREFEQRARELNTLNQGDQAAFYLRKPA